MRVIVAGLGSMGRRRVRNLRSLGVTDITGVEPRDDRRDEVTESLGIRCLGDLETALGDGADLVIVSTPPDQHLEPALLAARAGANFFIEASVVPEDTSELRTLVEREDLVGVPSCTMRFHPAVQVMRRRIEEDRIGRVLAAVHHMGQYLPDWHPWEDYRSFYVARRLTGAGREMVPFELNWMTYLLGRVTDVAGSRAKLSQLEIDIDDFYTLDLGFAGGARGALTVEVLSRPGIRLARLMGERGTLVWDWNSRHVAEWAEDVGDWVEHPDPPPVEGPGGSWVAENMYIAEMAALLAAVEGGEPFPHTLEEDQRLLDVLTAVEESSDSGRRIRLDA